MKQLTLLRHAKSSWSNEGLSDHERPLNKRGREAASLMGKFVAERGIAPQKVFCSTATRTHETCARVFEAAGTAPDIEFCNELYLASPKEMLSIARMRGGNAGSVMLIGHNPGTHMLAIELCDANSSDVGDITRLAAKFPTAGLAHYKLDIDDWSAAALGSGALQIFATPKAIAGE